MKILVLARDYPYPLSHGVNLRVAPFARYLCQSHFVELVCFHDTRPADHEEDVFSKVTVFAPPAREAPKGGWAALVEKFSMAALLPASAELQSYISERLAKQEYDVVFAYEPMVTNLPKLLNVPLVVDAIDSGLLQYWREFKFAATPKRRISMAKWLGMAYFFDKKYLARADAVVLVAEEDRRYFNIGCPDTYSLVIQNGVDREFFSPSAEIQESHEIVFEGSFSHSPNVDGAIYFCSEILPIIREKVSDIHLTLVGRSPPKEIEALASDQVTITGFVDDIRPYIHRASVFVCPLRTGGGIKNKVLQAWSMGKAVVATSASVGGLNVQDGENIIVQDDPKLFAKEVMTLIQNPSARAELGRKARKTILQGYSWDAKSAELEAVMTQLLEKRKQS